MKIDENCWTYSTPLPIRIGFGRTEGLVRAFQRGSRYIRLQEGVPPKPWTPQTRTLCLGYRKKVNNKEIETNRFIEGNKENNENRSQFYKKTKT